MPLKLRAVSPLPPFTFAPPSPGSPPANTPPPATASAPTNPTEFILEKDQSLFGAHPLETERGKGLLKCTKCGKVVTEVAASEHKRICAHVLDGIPLNNKKTVKKAETLKRRASEGSEETDSPSKKKQKQLPDDLSELPPLPSFKGMKKAEIKKLKKERERLEKKAAKQQAKVDAQERKRMRANEPIDLDRQCGVINDKNLPCSRSLTCKTHTVGAKRAVEGRSRPYDSLYLEWQRANNPNFKEPQKPGRKEKPDHEKKKSGKKKWGEFSMNGMGGGDNEGIREGEEGQRELEDIITFARMAGERCKTVIGNFGSGWDTLPDGLPRGAKNRKASIIGPVPVSTATAPTTSSAAGTSSNADDAKSGSNPATSSAAATTTITIGANPAIPPTPINKGTIPYSSSSVFKTAMTEYNGVGDMLTKALATRKQASAQAKNRTGAASSVQPSNSANRGIPISMATGGVRPHAPAHIQPLPASTS